MEFNFNIRKAPELLLDKVCLLARDRVVVSGDVQRGNFSGMFDGSYEVDGDQVSVSIKRKPIFISWSMVQKGLDYLAV